MRAAALCVAVSALFLPPGGCRAAEAATDTQIHRPVKIFSTIAAFFGGKQKAGSSAFNAMWGAGRDGERAGEELDKPYAQSVWLNAGIKLITSQTTRVPFGWFTDEQLSLPAGDDAKRAEFWRRPAIRCGEPMQRTDMIEALGGWGLLAGEMSVLLPESWMTSRERIEPFRIARPSRLRPLRAKFSQDILGWEYINADFKRELLLPGQVVRSVFWNPYDDERGLGAYEPAKVEIAADYHAGKFARNMAASNGSQATYITTDGPGLQKEQQDQITAALREKQRRIERGDFAPVFLNGGLKVEDPHARSVDAAFIAQRIEHRHAIAAALGIPMSMFDLAASYSTGAASDLYRLITCACEPFGQKLSELLSRVEEARSGAMVHCGFAWKQHPVMQQARIANFESAVKAWGAGIPWEVLNRTHQLELPEFEGDEVGFLPFSVQPVTQVLGTEAPEPVEPDEQATTDQLIEEAKRLMGVRIVEPPVTNHQSPVTPPALQLGQRTEKAKDKARVRLWQKHMAAQKPFTNKLHAAFGKVLAKHRRSVLDQVATLAPMKANKGVIDFVFDVADFLRGIIGAFRTVVPSTLTEAAVMAAEEFGGEFSPEPNWIGNYLAQRENKIADAGQATYDQIKGGIQAGIEAGDTMDELAKRVKDAFQTADRGRCEVIAQTETASAFGVARQASMEQAGITHKEWLSAQDDRVRDTHGVTDGQIVGVEELFSVGSAEADGAGVQMMHPCADGAPPEEVINCRCIAIGSIKLND